MFGRARACLLGRGVLDGGLNSVDPVMDVVYSGGRQHCIRAITLDVGAYMTGKMMLPGTTSAALSARLQFLQRYAANNGQPAQRRSIPIVPALIQIKRMSVVVQLSARAWWGQTDTTPTLA